MKKAIDKIRNVWAAVDIRKKILFTALILLIYRLGCAITVPYVSSGILESFESAYGSTIFGYMNVLSGGALGQATLFALGVSPYITAQIVIQLLTVAIPAFQRWSKDEDGKKRLTNITRIGTIILSLVTAFAYYLILKRQSWLVPTDREWLQAVVIIACFTAGAAIIMWLGEKINEKGIGNGISMILFANIISQGPSIAYNVYSLIKMWFRGTIFGVLTIIASLLIVFYIIYITNSERRIPIQYAKRVVGRKMYGGQNTNLPIKLNMSGVMPIIFASSIVSLPATIVALAGHSGDTSGFAYWVNQLFGTSSIIYVFIFLALILAFSYFYIMISFDPIEISNNLKNNGGSVPGIRPGTPTSDYIKKILNRITFIGAIFLAIIAGVPLLVSCLASVFNGATFIPMKQSITDFLGGSDVLTALISVTTFGGSSLLIVIGVALETYRDIEAQMSMRHYKGFLQ